MIKGPNRCRNPLFIDMLRKVSLHAGGVYTGPEGNVIGLLYSARDRIDTQLESGYW